MGLQGSRIARSQTARSQMARYLGRTVQNVFIYIGSHGVAVSSRTSVPEVPGSNPAAGDLKPWASFLSDIVHHLISRHDLAENDYLENDYLVGGVIKSHAVCIRLPFSTERINAKKKKDSDSVTGFVHPFLIITIIFGNWIRSSIFTNNYNIR